MKLDDLLPYALWLAAGVLSLVLAQRSQIDTWCEQNPRLAGALKLLRSLGLDPWALVQGLSLLVRGRLPVKLQAEKIVAASKVRVTPDVLAEVAKQSAPPPPDDGPPTPRHGRSVPPVVALLFAGSLALAGALPACSSPQQPASSPTELATDAREKARLAYSVATVALSAVAEIHADVMRATPSASAEVIAAHEGINARLHSARDALASVKPWLETGDGEAEAKRSLREGLKQVADVLTLLPALGAKVPPQVSEGVSVALAALGSEK